MKSIQLSNSDRVALVDDDDFENVSRHSWHIDARGYVQGKIGGKPITLHRFILGNNPDGMESDHKNRNKLDCRKSNLRFGTRSQNLANRKIQIDNKCGYKGVTLKPKLKRYRATISFNKKSIHLGYFDNPVDAAIAYDNAARKYFGEFANTNF